jgi:hypothetical protein
MQIKYHILVIIAHDDLVIIPDSYINYSTQPNEDP